MFVDFEIWILEANNYYLKYKILSYTVFKLILKLYAGKDVQGPLSCVLPMDT